MRRTASEVIRSLEMRVARLERISAPVPNNPGTPATCPICGAKTFEDHASAGIQYVGMQAHTDPKNKVNCKGRGHYVEELTSSQIAFARESNASTREYLDLAGKLKETLKKAGLKARSAAKGADLLLARKLYPTIEDVISSTRYYTADYDGAYFTINGVTAKVVIEPKNIRLHLNPPPSKGQEKVISSNGDVLWRLTL
jgi:hypothetical protein